ncbi:gem-associated protein 8-like isoform X3 [Bacillus rossius redtenbacheri]|uniref:gem-associated protein 8-like isoform X3 n=1 Tax=Bacillus rossius redtenbacheri TaxID=93214 RepID=UPI002FDED010
MCILVLPRERLHHVKRKLHNHPLLEKNKDQTGDQKVDAETLLQPPEMLARNRLEEMRELFGPAAPKLLAMETAVELTFNSNCDRHHPSLWPVVPLAAQAE